MAKAKQQKQSAPGSGPDGVPINMMEKKQDFTTSVQLWVGGPKMGKTSTAAALGEVSREYDLGFDPFFLMFEPGSGGVNLKCTSQTCPACEGTGKAGKGKCKECGGAGTIRLILHSEEEVKKWFEWAAESEYNPIIIDTGDAMYETVSEYVCKGLGIKSAYGADDHGMSWAMIRSEMRGLLTTITATKALIIIMHVQMQEVRIGGATMTKAVFNVAGKARTDLAAMADQYLHFTMMPEEKGAGERHVIIAAPQTGIEAGDRWGLFPEVLDLGKSAKEGAEAILEVFGYIERK
jgi:hypothetical protein